VSESTSRNYPLFSRNDLNGFWALFADNLANMVLISGFCLFVFKMPKDVVFGHIVPGLGIALLFGLGFYAYLARRMAAELQRDDITALPYGISTPVLFVYLFGVIGPVYGIGLSNKLSPSEAGIQAWQVGIAAAFIGGLIEMAGSAIGPVLKRITPRAGMLGTLAGISIVFIATVPMAEIVQHPLIGFPALAIVLIGLVAHIQFPFKIPAGLLAVCVGVVISLFSFESGQLSQKWSSAIAGLGFYPPLPVFGDLWHGLVLIFQKHTALLMVVLPISIYNFIETMNNVESAEAAGDTYPVRLCQVMDGAGTACGALFGSPFPTTVYIGHPAYKKLGSRSGYALAVGIFFFFIASFGWMNFFHTFVPVAAVAPILVFVGITLAGQAFQATPKAHAVAVAVSLIPHISSLLVLRMQGVMSAASSWLGPGSGIGAEKLQMMKRGIIAPELQQQFAKMSIHYDGQLIFSKGAIIVGLLWGAIVALLIDKKTREAALFALAAAVLSLLGLIHSKTGVGLHFKNPLFHSYLILAALCFVTEWFPQDDESISSPPSETEPAAEQS